MSAEHEKTKPQLPTRPRGGHPGFVLFLDEAGHQELFRKVAEANRQSQTRPK
ncbi:hypothetical protein ABZZ74_23440 [Streptomyces sp. NPDC006476]|uniref:hypothetical protein n=1 Tax=Streptomyces sp. NPDC006476 TaxID=3157175 RepID=UPI0033BDD6F0